MSSVTDTNIRPASEHARDDSSEHARDCLSEHARDDFRDYEIQTIRYVFAQKGK